MQPNARERHVVVGRVQGVGFRPFVYRLALDLGLTGSVRNAPEGVVIEVQGAQPSLEAFARDLPGKLPPLAMIVEHSRQGLPPVEGEEAFLIARSSAGQGHHVLVSPDVATCADCLADMQDPMGRRAAYPFTNCTNCGPRYTITRSLPYDRASTSMACFPLCPDCAREYDDPLDRRFHAQPNACPVCGPRIWFTDRQGREKARAHKAVEAAAKALLAGKILAVKGLGGFHLVVDALRPRAVEELRRRKRRPHKPLAVMVPDLESLSALAEFDPEEAAMLSGRERPIVLLRLKPGGPVASEVSPDTDLLGAMLPYTPLHHVLLERIRARTNGPVALVMTSGNASSEPICLGNREALARLSGIADGFLLHDRDILVRTDDSVVRFLPPASPDAEGARLPRKEFIPQPPTAGMSAPDAEAERPRLQFLRRARGFTPAPVFLPDKGPSVLGVGPELKNTVCLTKGDQAFLSQHVGDMQNLETARFHGEVIAHLRSMLQVDPVACVADLHPDYLSTRWALEESGLPVLRLQHHFAHVFAVMASNRLTGPTLGLAMDGSGYGGDGTIWGGEFLFVDPGNLTMRRVGHLRAVPLPGGEAAIRQPWRMALSYLRALGLEDDPALAAWPRERQAEARLVLRMMEQGLNSPATTSCGRLFDAVSALLGLCPQISFEGQAAIRLERVRDRTVHEGYECPALDGEPAVLDTLALFEQVARDVGRGTPAPVVSARFHNGLTRGLDDMARRLCEIYGTSHVALSGGVFLNEALSVRLPGALAASGLTAHVHRHEPPGDGCISLGQAFYGRLALEGGGF